MAGRASGAVRSYRAYQLTIASAVALPDLPVGAGRAEVFVRRRRTGRPATHLPAGGLVQVAGETIHLGWPGVGRFLVRRSREILVDPAPGASPGLFRLCLLGPVFAALLIQRGCLVLHASAVAVDGGAVAFLGGPGWGKSTLAAALHAGGRGVVSDDVLPVHVDGDGPRAVPAFPRLKLAPLVAGALGFGPGRPLGPRPTEKRSYPAARGFPAASLPLRKVYLVADGAEARADPLPAPAALIEVLRHTYGPRLIAARGGASHFRQCAGIAAGVSVSRLWRPRALAALPGLARLIEDDLAGPAGPGEARRA